MLSYFIRPTLYFLCLGLLNAYPLAATIQCDEKDQNNKSRFSSNNSSMDMDLDPAKGLSSTTSTHQEEPLFIETLPPEIWWSILDYLTNRHDLENLRRESKVFAWLVQAYLNDKEQKLGLIEPNIKSAYWRLSPEERKLMMTELKYTDPDRKLQNLNELKEIVTYLKGQEKIAGTLVSVKGNPPSQVTEEKGQIYKVLESKAKSFILGHLHDREAKVSLDEDMEEIDELALLLNTVIKPLPLSQEEINPSELYYQDLRLHYYCSQLFRLLGFEDDACSQLMLTKKSFTQNRDELNTLYFAFKHILGPDPKKSLEKAANNLNEEASFNIINLKAQYHLGKLYESKNQGVKTEFEEREENGDKALDWQENPLTREKRFSPVFTSHWLSVTIKKVNIDKALDWYEKALKKAESFSTLDKEQPLFINTKEGHIARKIYAKVHYRQGMINLQGRSLAGQYIDSAYEHLLNAARQGHAKAQHKIGVLYYCCYIEPRTNNYCLQKWHQEEERNCFDIAECSRPLSGICRRTWMDHKALFWWGHAAVQNQHDAQFYLSWMYKKGYGVRCSLEKSREYYEQGCAQGKTYPWKGKKNFLESWGIEDRHNDNFRNEHFTLLLLGFFHHINKEPEEAMKIYNKIRNSPTIYEIIRVLADKFSVKKITLNNGEISHKEIKYLANALKHNQTLTSLDLEANQISDTDVKDIALALKHNQTLTSLNLGSNRVSDAGVKHLANALKHNQTLTFLNLWNNQISDIGAEPLSALTNIFTLDLTKNNLSIKAQQKINQTLPICKIYF